MVKLFSIHVYTEAIACDGKVSRDRYKPKLLKVPSIKKFYNVRLM